MLALHLGQPRLRYPATFRARDMKRRPEFFVAVVAVEKEAAGTVRVPRQHHLGASDVLRTTQRTRKRLPNHRVHTSRLIHQNQHVGGVHPLQALRGVLARRLDRDEVVKRLSGVETELKTLLFQLPQVPHVSREPVHPLPELRNVSVLQLAARGSRHQHASI